MIISRSENQELRITKVSQIGTHDPIFVPTGLQRRPGANGPHLVLPHTRQAMTVLGKTNMEVLEALTCKEKMKVKHADEKGFEC